MDEYTKMKNPVEFGVFFFQVASISQHEKCSLAQACSIVKECGCDWVEIDADQLSEERMIMFQEAGLAVSSIYCFLNFHQDVEVRIQKLLDTARMSHPKFVMPIPEEDNSPELREQIIPTLRHLQKELKKLNIQMVMEDYDGPNKSFATSEGLHRYIEEIPGLKCCFDTGNFYYSGEDARKVFPKFAADTVHFHFKDRRLDEQDGTLSCTIADGRKTSFAAIGNGILPLRELFFDILSNGYHGIIVAEHAFCHDPLGIFQRSLATMQEWCRIWNER